MIVIGCMQPPQLHSLILIYVCNFKNFRCHRYWSYCSYFCNNRSDRCRGNLFSMYVFTSMYWDGMIAIITILIAFMSINSMILYTEKNEQVVKTLL